MSNEEMNKENVDMAELSDDELEQASGGILVKAKFYSYICTKCKNRAFFRQDWSDTSVVAFHKTCSLFVPLRPLCEDDGTGPYHEIVPDELLIISGYHPPK